MRVIPRCGGEVNLEGGAATNLSECPGAEASREKRASLANLVPPRHKVAGDPEARRDREGPFAEPAIQGVTASMR